ncbi:MAG: phosphoglucosamine mutase [Gammaproteobacteria bacterium]|nr:phosphoglucosamine mutase [Gammaproteobacteria bacterium]
MANERKYFGTDGVRGTVGEPPITPDFVMKLGWAAGRVLGRQSGARKMVLIGKDTRVSGYMFESALEAGLSAAGIDSHMLGPMPTPGIAYLTRTFRAQAGIVISASHNPYDDNGIKFFASDGMKLPDSIELEIEQELEQPMQTVLSKQLGKAHRVNDAAGRYIEYCKSTFGNGKTLKGMRIVLDCAHGATYHVAPAVFSELGAEVHVLGASPNGFNINDNCGATAPDALREKVLAVNADVGIALDGDGDRLIMVDSLGGVVDGDELLYIIARYQRQQGRLSGSVVGTQMSNLGLEHAIKRLGLGFERTKVGDRYILECLNENGWVLGGETSGHLLCLDMTTTGDGIISALQVLCAMLPDGATLHDLKSGMSKYPQRLINVRLAERCDVFQIPSVCDAVAAVENELGNSGRVLLRPSGTEPVIRVMVEGEDSTQVDKLAQQLADAVSDAVGAAVPA